MTIKELRIMEVKRLHSLKGCTNDNVLDVYNKNYWSALDGYTYQECEEEAKLMRRFYRLSGLSDRIFNLENSESYMVGNRWGLKRLEEMENQQEKMWKKLQKDFDAYGLTIMFNNWLPSLCKKYDGGGISEVIQRWYY